MKRRLVFGLAICLVVFVVLGCGVEPPKKGQFNFKQGTPELQVKFLPGSPPENIYPDSEFKIMVEMDNQAAYPVLDGKMSLIGIIDRYFTFDAEEQPFDYLEGRSLTSPAGEKKWVEFNGRSAQPFENSREFENNFILLTSYRSTMDFVDTVCINPSLYATFDAGCLVQSKKSYSGQGAPLAVAELEEIISSASGVEFRMMLKNRGRGKVKSITINSARLGSDQLECEFPHARDNKKMIELVEEKQEAVLRCSKALANQRSYTTSMVLSFSYLYEKTEKHQLKLVGS